MNAAALIATAHAMLSEGRGLLAMDESTGTCNKRLVAAGIPATSEGRRAWRELLVTAPGLGESIGGAILYNETIRQSTAVGTRFVDVDTDDARRARLRERMTGLAAHALARAHHHVVATVEAQAPGVVGHC